jgi:hypothetical protein
MPQTLVASLLGVVGSGDEATPSVMVDLEVEPSDAPLRLEVWAEGAPYQSTEKIAGSSLEEIDGKKMINQDALSSFISIMFLYNLLVKFSLNLKHQTLVRVIGALGNPLSISALCERNLEKFPKSSFASSKRGKGKEQQDDENRDGLPFQGIKLLYLEDKYEDDGSGGGRMQVPTERYKHGWYNIVEDEDDDGVTASDQEDINILVPNIDLEGKLSNGTSMSVSFSIELHFAPHLKWPPLKQEIVIPIVSGPPVQWQISAHSLPSNGAAASSSSPKGGKLSLRCGDPISEVVSELFLVDQYKNRISDCSRWADILSKFGGGPKVTFEAHPSSDSDDGIVIVPVQFKGSQVTSSKKKKKKAVNSEGAVGFTEVGSWHLDPQALSAGMPGKAKLKVCSGIDQKDIQQAAEAVGVNHEDALVLANCKDLSKSVVLLAGLPHRVLLRSRSLAGCEEWGETISAVGDIPAGYSLEDLDLKVRLKRGGGYYQ